MQKFNNENIITGYIKQLLHSFNLPQCRVFKTVEEARAFANPLSGFICIIRDYAESGRAAIVRFDNSGETKLSNYDFGLPYLNVTKNLNLTNGVYDSKTHRYLGEYIRFLRDYADLDLTTLYNFYDGETYEYLDHIYIKVPVRYDTKYTCAFDYLGTIEYLVCDRNTTLKDIEDTHGGDFTSLCINGFNDLNCISVDKPPSPSDIFREKNLCILFRLPTAWSASTVVLEGDYTQNSKDFTSIQINYDKAAIEAYDDFDITPLLSSIRLLKDKPLEQGVSYPFSDRLIEYLTENAITDLDLISKDILDAKDKLTTRYWLWDDNKPHNSAALRFRNSGHVDTFTRLAMLDIVNKNKFVRSDTSDLLGYVDSTIEELLDDERYPEAASGGEQ